MLGSIYQSQFLLFFLLFILLIHSLISLHNSFSFFLFFISFMNFFSNLTFSFSSFILSFLFHKLPIFLVLHRSPSPFIYFSLSKKNKVKQVIKYTHTPTHIYIYIYIYIKQYRHPLSTQKLSFGKFLSKPQQYLNNKITSKNCRFLKCSISEKNYLNSIELISNPILMYLIPPCLTLRTSLKINATTIHQYNQ